MVFGQPERFAVESIAYDRTPEQVLGYLRLFIGGYPVGDFAQGIVLNTPAMFIRDFLALPGPRNHASLAGKTSEEILAIVHWAHYSDGTNSTEEQAHSRYREFFDVYSRCELCPALSASFDGEQAVFLEEEGQDRIILRPFRQHSVREVVLHMGECLTALTSFVNWFGRIEKGL